MKLSTLPLFAAAVTLALALSSCGLQKSATRTEPTRFLKTTGTDISQRVARLPFEHSWRDPKVDMTKYKYIVVRPITTAFLRSEQWEESKSAAIPSKSAYLKRCKALARYWEKSLNKALSSPLCMFYRTSDTSKPGTLVFEVALTEVRFDRPTGRADAPMAAAGSIVSAVTGPPTCAFEARSRDAATGKLVSTAADRRGPDMKMLNSVNHSLSQPNEAICDEWSRQMMERYNIEIYPTVKRSWFSFL